MMTADEIIARMEADIDETVNHSAGHLEPVFVVLRVAPGGVFVLDNLPPDKTVRQVLLEFLSYIGEGRA